MKRKEGTQPQQRLVLFEIAGFCRTRDVSFPSACHSSPVQHRMNFHPSLAHIFLSTRTQQRDSVKAWIIIPAPHSPLSQLPSKKCTEASDQRHHDMGSVHHSSSRPLTPSAAHRSDSLLCSRKICVRPIGSSLSQVDSSPHHSRATPLFSLPAWSHLP